MTLSSGDGTPLHASLFRSASPRAGLLVVHGLQSHSGWFEASGTLDGLAARGITSLAYDRRGSGRSGGVRGHCRHAQDFLDDLEAVHRELETQLESGFGGAGSAPIHIMANCFGTRFVLPYLEAFPGRFRSVLLTAPATHMSRRVDYSLAQKIRALLSPSSHRQKTPLEDSFFVSEGPWLEWVREDPHALREVSSGFLRSTAGLTRRMGRAAGRLDLPLLVVLGTRDVMVRNAAIRREFVAKYRGRSRVVEFDTEHYIDFTEFQPRLEAEFADWILGTEWDAGGETIR